jgi:lysophospholipase L1-like esterase
MKLTKETLSALLVGAVDIREEDGFFVLSRFTEKQTAYYKEKSLDNLYRKVHASAGMRLELRTDADALSFDYRVVSASSRTFYSIDLYVDGVFCDEVYVMNVLRQKGGHVRFSLPAGEHRVTVFFSNLMRTDISEIVLEDASFAEPIPMKTKILFLGDSITQGYDAYHSSLSYANRIARALDADVLNQAIGGEIFDEGIIDEALSYDPDTVIVAYGTNDWALQPSREAFLAAADAFFRRVKALYGNRKLVYISPIFRGGVEGKCTAVGAFKDSVEALKKISSLHGFHLVDGFTLTPHIEDFFADKDLHPNDLGFAFYAENLLSALKKI